MRNRFTIELSSMRVFLAVSEMGSMTTAARKLGMTQSAVSQAIRQMEEGLGVILIDREFRPLQLTSSGTILRQHAHRILADTDHLTSALQAGGTVPGLRMGMLDSFAATVGPSLIRTVSEYARDVFVYQGFSPEHLRGFRARELDIIISAELLSCKAEELSLLLLREPFVLVLPKEHSEYAQHSNLKQIARNLPLVRYSARSTAGLLTDRYLEKLGLINQRRLEVETAEVLCSLVAAGVGWAITTPLHLLQGRPQFEGISVQPLPEEGISRDLSLLVRRDEFETMGRALTKRTHEILRAECLPPLFALMPWLKGVMKAGDDIGD
jgi:molybdate transport repressor ModE-like protein